MKELYAEHPAMFKNHPLGFILAVLLIPVAVGILILLWWYLQAKSSKLTVFENVILFEQGLLSKERAEVSTSIVRTVRIKQSFFNRIFGVGTVSIYTAGDNPEIVAHGLPDPDRIRELVKQRMNAA